jgi:hypothetical protein
LYVSEALVSGVIRSPSLDVVAGVRAAVEERRHVNHSGGANRDRRPALVDDAAPRLILVGLDDAGHRA